MSKKRRHAQPPLPPRGPRLEEVVARAMYLQEQGRLEEALRVLEEAPPHFRRRLELQLPRGLLYTMLGDLDRAMEVLEEASRVEPGHPVVAFFLAGVYDGQEMTGHALRAIRTALQHEDFLSENMLIETRKIAADLEEEVSAVAADHDVSVEVVEDALYAGERATRLMLDERYHDAIRLFRRSAELLPTESSSANNEALCYFDMGDAGKAIQLAQEVLATCGDDLYALSNLIRFHVARDEREQAAAYAERLERIPCGDDPSRLSKAVEAFGLLSDDAAIFALYQHHRQSIDDLDGLALLNVGSAAANLGRMGIARRLWTMARENGASPAAVEALLNALHDKKPGPGLASRYPTIVTPTLITAHRLQELVEILGESGDVEPGDRPRLRRFEKFVARTPFITLLATKFLWEEEPSVGIRLLSLIATPAAIAELKRFAFGQVGPAILRGEAVQALSSLGEMDISQPVELWDDERQEWRPVRLARWKIVSSAERPNYGAQVWQRIDAGTVALEAGNFDAARENLEAALALEPRAAVAHHNMAVLLQREGNREAALDHLHRALEINPGYVFARCTLAQHLIGRREMDAALALLDPVLDVPTLHVGEWKYYQRTMAELAIANEDYDAAESHLKLIVDLDPDDESARGRLRDVQMMAMNSLPFWAQMRARDRRRQEAKRGQPLARDAGLVECLERLTKEALVGTARHMPEPRPYNVRKAALIHDLADYLSDPDCLEELVQELLKEEVGALRDVLQAGGVMPLETFAERHDDDIDESPYWQYHEPETVMGYLRMLGLLSLGTVDGQLSVLIPRELRPLLPPALDAWTGDEEEEEA